MGIKPTQMILRATFVINLILGIAFWTGHESGGWKLVHMLLGIVFVAALFWIGAAQAMRGGSLGITAGTFVIGLALAIVGLTQEGVDAGWIKVVHLLLALLAIGLGEMAGARASRASANKA
jgi:uncharacterized membrane protein